MKSVFSVVWKILLSAAVIAGVAVTVALSETPLKKFNLFFYFTIQSNLILLGVTVAGIIRILRGADETRAGSLIRTGSVLWIMITALVFHFMLFPLIKVTSAGWWVSLISLHYITPAMAVINWVVFEGKGRVSLKESLLWIFYPFFFFLVSIVRLLVDGYYPYWFLNPSAAYPKGIGSWGGLFVCFLLLAVSFGLLGLVVAGADRLMGRRKN